MSNPANPLLRLRALPDLRLRRARLGELVLGGEDEFVRWLGEVVVRARDGDGDAALTVVAWGSLLVQAASEAELTEALAGLLAAWLAEASDEVEGEEEDGEPHSLVELFIEAVVGPAEHRRLSPRVKLEGGGVASGDAHDAGRRVAAATPADGVVDAWVRSRARRGDGYAGRRAVDGDRRARGGSERAGT